MKLNFCCPMNCAFCISSGDAFSKVTAMNPDSMALALKGLKERYDTPYFMFADHLSTSASATQRRWPRRSSATTSASCGRDCAYGKHLTRESLQLFRASGACRLVWGLETAAAVSRSSFTRGSIPRRVRPNPRVVARGRHLQFHRSDRRPTVRDRRGYRGRPLRTSGGFGPMSIRCT